MQKEQLENRLENEYARTVGSGVHDHDKYSQFNVSTEDDNIQHFASLFYGRQDVPSVGKTSRVEADIHLRVKTSG